MPPMTPCLRSCGEALRFTNEPGIEMSANDDQIVLGINAAYHESSAALLIGDRLVFAVEEERLSRIKHAKQALVSNPDELPWRAIRACLSAGGLSSLRDCDAIGYSLLPGRRIATVGGDPYPIESAGGFGTARGEAEFDRRVRRVPQLLADAADDQGVANKVHFVSHHRAHAASALFCSPFEHAALLVIDGIGEDSTAWLGLGTRDGLMPLEEIAYPDSIGLLWERVAVYLGFTEYDACKVMGLAAYGNPDRFERQFELLFRVNKDPSGGPQFRPFEIDATLARFRSGDVLGLESLLGPRRTAGSPFAPRYADVAAALQRRTEQAVLAACHRLAVITGEKLLAYSGGVALNCVANTRIESDGPFDEIFVVGAAHDAGTAIGAAAELSPGLWRNRSVCGRPVSPFVGPSYLTNVVDCALERMGCENKCIADPVQTAVSLLSDGNIVGWFQGPLEFGPRALGSRSLLVDPRRNNIRDRLNSNVKHREGFRPFGAAVLAEHASDWFEIPSHRIGLRHSRDLMIVAYRVRPEKAGLIPAVVHHDGTCRVQIVEKNSNPLFHRLLESFYQATGIPLLLNTSFNDQEPLVATPEDALSTFSRTEIDYLILHDRLVSRKRGAAALKLPSALPLCAAK